MRSLWSAALAVAAAGMTVRSAAAAKVHDPSRNAMLLADMAQNNPGDKVVAWQGTKYTNPYTLKHLNFTTRVTTGELSPFLAVDFHTIVPGGIWEDGSPEKAWASAMADGVRRHAAQAHASGISFIPFVDMIVLPKALVARYAKDILSPAGTIVYNEVTQTLLSAMLNETFAAFDIDGILIRTGETYTFDTPYHTGNSPVDHVPGPNQTAVWVSWLTHLRTEVCVNKAKIVVQRAWDSFGGWTGDPGVYEQITDPVEPHPLLYFSVKVSSGDFFRFMPWNRQLGVGKHAQLIEAEIQREYEGKLAHPNYVAPGYIYGFGDLPDGSDANGIIDVLALPQVRGLWTWSRGGGWWGPYIHQREEWVDAAMSVMGCWWNANFAHAKAQAAAGLRGRPTEAKTEAECFDDFAAAEWGLDGGSAAGKAMRHLAVSSPTALLWSRYCPEGPDYSDCWIWTRDDRLGGLQQGLGKHFQAMVTSADPDAALNASIAWKDKGIALWAELDASTPAIADALVASGRVQEGNYVQVSVEFGLRVYTIVREAFEIFAWGVRHDHGLWYNATALGAAIRRYDAAWAGYASFGLAFEEAPSLYKPYYWNSATDPTPQPGMNASVNVYRPLVSA